VALYGEVLFLFDGNPGGYNYSTDWSQGGPIIEREKIGVNYQSNKPLWVATPPLGANYKRNVGGTTPLVAAMRSYVASKLGDEVEIPEELK